MERNKAGYPLLLQLSGKRCLVVGGGTVAERKAASLLEAGALVTVISPEATSRLEQWAQERALCLLKRSFAAGMPELADALLIFAATDDRTVNEQVREEAERFGKLVNIADEHEGGGFTVPAVVRRGRLTLAVSTGGASPGLAAAIRKQLEAQYGEAYETYLDLLYSVRMTVQQSVGDRRVRQEMMRLIVSWELLPYMETGLWRPELGEWLLHRIAEANDLEDVTKIREDLEQMLDTIETDR